MILIILIDFYMVHIWGWSWVSTPRQCQDSIPEADEEWDSPSLIPCPLSLLPAAQPCLGEEDSVQQRGECGRDKSPSEVKAGSAS